MIVGNETGTREDAENGGGVVKSWKYQGIIRVLRHLFYRLRKVNVEKTR